MSIEIPRDTDSRYVDAIIKLQKTHCLSSLILSTPCDLGNAFLGVYINTRSYLLKLFLCGHLCDCPPDYSNYKCCRCLEVSKKCVVCDNLC